LSGGLISKEHMLSEIKRVAALNEGQPPGEKLFLSETNISKTQWVGRHWSKWSDALKEAGFQPNQWIKRSNSNEMLREFARIVLSLGYVPSAPELQIMRRSNDRVVSPKTLREHFKAAELRESLSKLGQNEAEFRELLFIVPSVKLDEDAVIKTSNNADGSVYLLKSGEFYKIGRSDQLEKRVKQINVALPEVAILFHTIVTDDPSGIEAYWHKRFADRRLNGEWFKLSKQDVAAFKRRKFQ
jgi:Meiotically up-regulated gene 113